FFLPEPAAGPLPFPVVLLLGLSLGLGLDPVRTTLIDEFSAPPWMAPTVVGACLLLAGVVVGLPVLALLAVGWHGVLALTALAACLLAGYVLFVPLLELGMASVGWLLHPIHAHGPGKDCIPHRGPLLIVANHVSYFDPFFLGKVVPRKLRPL